MSYALPQEAPATGGTVIYPLVIDDLRALAGNHPIVEQVVADIMERVDYGLKKYGVPLSTHNRRSGIIDGYQELSDAAHYFRQLMAQGIPAWMDKYDLEGMYRRTLRDMLAMRQILNERDRRALLGLTDADPDVAERENEIQQLALQNLLRRLSEANGASALWTFEDFWMMVDAARTDAVQSINGETGKTSCIHKEA